jgi:diguanylate cyclase (GGDEF)-like protein
MRPVLLKSLATTAVAVMLAFLLSFAVRAALHAPMDHVTLLNLTVIPPLITFPLSMFVYRQGEKLRRAHESLTLAHRVLADRASHDGLTGLLNRESFLVPLELSRFDEPRGVLLILDADYFKRINDTCGHEAGDEALQAISRAIKQAVRPVDPVGRLGGEEFGVFLGGADLSEARLIAERIRASVEALSFAPRQCGPMPLSVSIGGTLCHTGADCADILRAADRSLYEAKGQGRNRVVIDAGLAAAA